MSKKNKKSTPKRHYYSLGLVIRSGDTVITKSIRGYVDADKEAGSADFGQSVGQIIAAAAPALVPHKLVNGSVAQAIAEAATDYLEGMEL